MGRVHDFLINSDTLYRILRQIRREKKKIKDPCRQNILMRYELSEEEKQQIDDLYVNSFGRKIPYDWHKYYASYTGKFDPQYIPELLFIPFVEELFVPREYMKVFSDKNLLQLIVGKAKTPEVVISCTDGIYRNSEMRFISKTEAISRISNGDFFIKPSIDSNSGRGCAILKVKNGVDDYTQKTMNEIFNEMGNNFCVQKLVKNAQSIKKLHPSSLNTFRITTYIWNNRVYTFPVIMRIGRGQNHLDNAHQGGLFIAVDDFGFLGNCAFTEFQDRFTEHPDTGIVFKGYKIEHYTEMVDKVTAVHERIPNIKMISWDVTLDDNNETVIIEANLEGQSVWMSQMAHGKGVFDENTREILSYLSRFKWFL